MKATVDRKSLMWSLTWLSFILHHFSSLFIFLFHFLFAVYVQSLVHLFVQLPWENSHVHIMRVIFRLSEKLLSFYEEIIDAQRILVYIILSNYLRSILCCWDKHRDISQTFHVCMMVHCCKSTTRSGQPNKFHFDISSALLDVPKEVRNIIGVSSARLNNRKRLYKRMFCLILFSNYSEFHF